MQDRQTGSKSLWYSSALGKREDTLPSCYPLVLDHAPAVRGRKLTPAFPQNQNETKSRRKHTGKKREFSGSLNFGLVARLAPSHFVPRITSRLPGYRTHFLLSHAVLHHGSDPGVALALQGSVPTRPF